MRILLINPPMPGKSCYPPFGLLSIGSMSFPEIVNVRIKDYNLLFHEKKLSNLCVTL